MKTGWMMMIYLGESLESKICASSSSELQEIMGKEIALGVLVSMEGS